VIFGEPVHVVRVDVSDLGWVWVCGATQGWRRLTYSEAAEAGLLVGLKVAE
jgi:hypothetical protein